MDIPAVKHIAQLSRLQISEKETECFAGELSSILAHVSELESVDTKGVPVTGSGGVAHNVFRADETARAADAELSFALVNAAPDKEDGYVKVKAIL